MEDAEKNLGGAPRGNVNAARFFLTCPRLGGPNTGRRYEKMQRHIWSFRKAIEAEVQKLHPNEPLSAVEATTIFSACKIYTLILKIEKAIRDDLTLKVDAGRELVLEEKKATQAHRLKQTLRELFPNAGRSNPYAGLVSLEGDDHGPA